MKRKIKFGIICIVLIVAAIFLGYGLFTPAQKTDSIKVGYSTANMVEYAPFCIAYAKGFFSEHNVSVEPVPLSSSSETRLALSAGQIDVGFAGSVNFFAPISKGVPIKIIGPMASAKSYLYVRPDNKTRTFEDFIGKSIVATPGSSSEYDIRRVLKKENINASKINFVDVGKAYRHIALMEQKIVDAVLMDHSEIAKYSALGAVPLEEWGTNGYDDQYNPKGVIAINEKFRLSHSQLTEQFIDALIEGHRFMKSNPEEAAQIVSAYTKTESENIFLYAPEDITAMWKNKEIEYNLWYDPNILVYTSEIAVEIGQLNSSFSLDQIYDPSFEEKLKAAQNEIYSTN